MFLFSLPPLTSLYLYFVSVFLLLNFSHPFFFWLLMELNLLFFLYISYSCSFEYKSLMKTDTLFFYFLLQSGASLLFLICLLSDIFLTFHNFSSLLMTLIIFFKLGLFPFHFWMFSFCEKMPSLEVLFLLIFQKIPFLFFLFYSNFNNSAFLVLVSSLISCFFLWGSSSLVQILVSSSIYTTFWLMIFFEGSVLMFLLFLILYFFLNLEGCFLKAKTHFESASSNILFSFFFLVVFLMGLPPFCLFFFKFFSLEYLLDGYGVIFAMFSWLLTYGVMMGYFKFFLVGSTISLNAFSFSSLFKIFFMSFFLFFFFFFF